MSIISLGYSPCPNDTFIFYALTHKKIDTEDLAFREMLLDGGIHVAGRKAILLGQLRNRRSFVLDGNSLLLESIDHLLDGQAHLVSQLSEAEFLGVGHGGGHRLSLPVILDLIVEGHQRPEGRDAFDRSEQHAASDHDGDQHLQLQVETETRLFLDVSPKHAPVHAQY